jgi:hypothetical protein
LDVIDLEAKLSEVGRTIATEERKLLNANINSITRIRERDFPEQTIPVKAAIREAIDIFYKVNASGVALTDAELASLLTLRRGGDSAFLPARALLRRRPELAPAAP